MFLKSQCIYDIISPSSLGIRITPIDRQPVHLANFFRMQVTSAETNVLSIPAALGMTTKVLTAFVQGSPVALLIKADLRRRNIAYEGPDIVQQGPWGVRHQCNIADSGFGARGPRVWNDRAGEVAQAMKPSDYDIYRLFNQEGVRILHLSGLIAALSIDSANFCLELARRAKACGTMVSFDLNYRSSFWRGRESELRSAFTAIAAESDLLFGNEEDFQSALGFNEVPTGGRAISTHRESFQRMIEAAAVRFPHVTRFVTTWREVIDANHHLWGAMTNGDGSFHIIEPRQIEVLDRIGGGDAFVGGFLYGLLRGWSLEDVLHFAWAGGALATTLLDDFVIPVDEDQLWDIWHGNARVRR